MYIYIYIYDGIHLPRPTCLRSSQNIYIYIYIERERDNYIHLCMYVYISRAFLLPACAGSADSTCNASHPVESSARALCAPQLPRRRHHPPSERQIRGWRARWLAGCWPTAGWPCLGRPPRAARAKAWQCRCPRTRASRAYSMTCSATARPRRSPRRSQGEPLV